MLSRAIATDSGMLSSSIGVIRSCKL
eukprot:COSAG02_NODE_37448_length_441_cov_11.074074_1_plen_25_part_01